MSFFMRNYRAVQAFLNLQLPAKAKHVFLTLDLRANKEGVCWPSLARLTRDASSSRSAVASALARLVKENLIERISTAGRVTHYRIIDPQRFLARVKAQEAPQKDPGIGASHSDPANNEPGPSPNPSKYWTGTPSDPSNIWTQNIYHFIGIEQQQRISPPSPKGRAVVVVSGPTLRQDLNLPISAFSESAAGALDRPPAKDQICASPGLSPTSTLAASEKGKTPMQAPPTPPLAIVLPPGSLFAPHTKQLGEVVSQYGVERVLSLVDQLDYQSRQSRKPIRDPIALLVSCFKKGMITPTGYKTREEREAERRRKELQEAERKAEEARKRQEAETLRQKDAQDQALWETLPEEERALWVRQVAPEVPEVCRSEFLLGMLARAAFLEYRSLHGDPAREGLTAPRPSDGHPCHNGQANPGFALALS